MFLAAIMLTRPILVISRSSHTLALRPSSGGGLTKPPRDSIRSSSPGLSGLWSLDRATATCCSHGVMQKSAPIVNSPKSKTKGGSRKLTSLAASTPMLLPSAEDSFISVPNTALESPAFATHTRSSRYIATTAVVPLRLCDGGKIEHNESTVLLQSVAPSTHLVSRSQMLSAACDVFRLSGLLPFLGDACNSLKVLPYACQTGLTPNTFHSTKLPRVTRNPKE